jgi:hypothetical protein
VKAWKPLAVVALAATALVAGNNRIEKLAASKPHAAVASPLKPTARVKAPAPIPVSTPIPVGQLAQLRFADLSPEVARKSHIGYYPRPAGSIWFPAVGLDGTVVAFFSSPVPTKILVWIDSPGSDGAVQHAETEIVVGAPSPPEPPLPPEPPQPPDPPKPTLTTLLLITASGNWCDACTAVAADTVPTLKASLGNRLTVADYQDAAAKTAYPESALVPRWVLTRPDGKIEKAIGYKTASEIEAWIAGEKGKPK